MGERLSQRHQYDQRRSRNEVFEKPDIVLVWSFGGAVRCLPINEGYESKRGKPAPDLPELAVYDSRMF
jgi:hypothetical protein